MDENSEFVAIARVKKNTEAVIVRTPDICCGLPPYNSWTLSAGGDDWYARSKTDSINPLGYNWCLAGRCHLHPACTDISDARTAGNCRYWNWFNYHLVRYCDGVDTLWSKSEHLVARYFHRKRLIAVTSSIIAFYSTLQLH